MSRLKPYTKYQPVNYDYVSQLPEGWQLLPNIAIFRERIERGFDNEELLSVTIGKGVIRQSEIDIKKDSSNEDKSKYKLIKVGDIAYNRMRMWQGALGYSEYQGITSPAYVVLKPRMEINQRFFHYMFRTGFYTNYSKRFSYGIVDDQLSLRYVDFKRMYSIVPPLETQNAIVAYLDRKTQQIQGFIAKKERLIELLEEEKDSVIYKIIKFGINKNHQYKESGVSWLGEIPKDWKIRHFGWEVIIQEGPGIMAFDFKNDGVPLLRISGMKNEIADLEGCNYLEPQKVKTKWYHFKLFEGDIIISCSASTDIVCTVGKEAEGAIPYTGIIRLTPRVNGRRLLKEYLKIYIKSKIYQQQVELLKAGSTIQHYGPTHLKGFFLLLPEINEQELIIKSARSETEIIDKAILKAQTEIEKAKEYQESLITQIVTGQLKVPEKANAYLGQNIALGMVAEPETAYPVRQ
ncbi:MAG: restriction endonuclease subunit S [Bacteroidales bacterium]|nr:restriction endonuclease subunit S [Bacteroidales bacterium]